MARKTVSVVVVTCDFCKGKIDGDNGLWLQGFIYPASSGQDPAPGPLVGEKADGEIASCWTCWRRRVVDPEIARLVSECAAKVEQAQASLKRDLSHAKIEIAGLKQSLKQSIDDQSKPERYGSYDPPYRSGGGGASGPLSPPDLPHYVRVTSALAGVDPDET